MKEKDEVKNIKIACHNLKFMRVDYQLKVCTANINFLGWHYKSTYQQPF